jgi:integrase
LSLYKRGNVWWSKLYRDGRPVYQSTEIAVTQEGVDAATLKREAQRKDKAWAGDIAKGTFLPQADRVTYDELVEDLKRHYTTTGSRNLVEVDKRLAHLTPFFRRMRAARIDATTVARYVEHRQWEGAANGTINRELGILTRVFRLAVTRKRVAAPLVIEEKPKEAAPRAGFFEREQFEWVRKRLSEDLQAAVTVAYSYGWRTQSEVLPLERRQLDLEAETLRLDPGRTKNGDGRLVYLTPELKTLLSAQLERVKALEKKLGRVIPYLFPHLGQKGSHINPRLVGTPRADFRKAWVTACKKAGVPGALRHDFRRTAVRNMVNEGVPERVAMKVTGHRTRSVFDRYHIVSPADLKEASRRLAQAGR